MKTILYSYRIRLYPNKAQELLLSKHFGCTRYVYNYFLNERIIQYKNDHKSDDYFRQCSTLSALKKKEDTYWLNEVNSQSLQFSLKCLDAAYCGFLKNRTGFPKFKTKKSKNTFTVPQRTRLIHNKIYIPKFQEGIKIVAGKTVSGKIKRCTLSKTQTGKYYASILTELNYQPSHKTGSSCGIDLGLKHFAITSDGVKFINHKYIKQYEQRLVRAQKHLSRKTKGSNSFEKQRRKVALIHEKIANSRMDALHKVSHKLVADYDVIALEDLNVKGMIKNHKLAKHILDASWGTFIRLLEYKSDWNDKQVVKINRWSPSSKTCYECGWINKDLNLSIREWTCKNGHVLDRDINAAKNILKEGLSLISAGAVDYKDGDGVRSSNTQLSVKS